MGAHFLTGFLTGLALIVAIGAQNSFVLRQGIRREHVLLIAFICAFSDALLIATGIAGLGVLIQRQPAQLDIARYGGAAFLSAYGVLAAYRAWQGERFTAEESGPVPRLTAVTTCLGLTLLNPHVYLDTVVFLGALANQRGETGRWIFGAGAVSASILWFFGLAYGARLLAPVFQKPMAWRVLDSFIALIMLSLAISLFQPR